MLLVGLILPQTQSRRTVLWRSASELLLNCSRVVLVCIKSHEYRSDGLQLWRVQRFRRKTRAKPKRCKHSSFSILSLKIDEDNYGSNALTGEMCSINM